MSYNSRALKGCPRESMLVALETERDIFLAPKAIASPAATETRAPAKKAFNLPFLGKRKVAPQKTAPRKSNTVEDLHHPVRWRELAAALNIADISLGFNAMPGFQTYHSEFRRLEILLQLNSIALKHKIPLKPTGKSNGTNYWQTVLPEEARAGATVTNFEELMAHREASRASNIPLSVFIPSPVWDSFSRFEQSLFQKEPAPRTFSHTVVHCLENQFQPAHDALQDHLISKGGEALKANDSYPHLVELARWTNDTLPLFLTLESYLDRPFRDSIPPSHIFLCNPTKERLLAVSHLLWCMDEKRRPHLVIVETKGKSPLYQQVSSFEPLEKNEPNLKSLIGPAVEDNPDERFRKLCQTLMDKVTDHMISLESTLADNVVTLQDFFPEKEGKQLSGDEAAPLFTGIGASIASCLHDDLRKRLKISPDSRFLITD